MYDINRYERSENHQPAQRMEVVTMTPDLCDRLLAANTNNRNVSPRTVNQYMSDMLGDRWVLSTPLQVEGPDLTNVIKLQSGQHRLLAWKAAREMLDAQGKDNGHLYSLNIKFWVQFNVDDDTRFKSDTGRAVSSGDMLRMKGETDSNTRAAAILHILRYENCPHLVWTGGNTSTNFTKSQINDWHNIHGHELDEQVYSSTGSWATASSYMAFRYLVRAHSANSELLKEFHSGVITGANLRPDDPRLTLRNRDAKSLRWAYGQSDLFALIYAWNKFVLGEPCKIIRIGQKNLPMPKIK
jgi:hypothetical protein